MKRLNINREVPHKEIGKVIVSVIEGAQSVGGTITGVLDQPSSAVGGPEMPHHIVDNYLDTGAGMMKDLVKRVSGTKPAEPWP